MRIRPQPLALPVFSISHTLAATLAALAALAMLACGGPPQAAPPPSANDIPPTTKDPGAARDEKPLQPSPPPGPAGGGSAAEPGASGGGGGRPDGAACLVGPECASGVCEGEGCTDDRPGVCAPRSRACTKDLRQYCGCDGKTFGSSGTCPGRRFAARAPCGS